MTENVTLTEGFFQELWESNQESQLQPTLQILRSRIVDNSKTICMRMQLSDGLFTFSSCGMNLDLLAQLERDGLTRGFTPNDTEFPIIQLIRFSTNFSEKKTVTISEYKLLPSSPKIGSPMNHNGDASAFKGMLAAKKRLNSNGQAVGGSPAAPSKRSKPLGGSSAAGTVPYAALTPYMAVGRWKIKGVVVKKEPLREFASKIGRGPSKVFGFEMADESGQAIKLSAFGDTAESIYPQLQEGQTYYVSGSSSCIKGANKRFNNTGLDYEIGFNNDCKLEPAEEQIEKPKLMLKVAPLDQLASFNNQSVDILAIIEKIDDCQTIMSRDQRELKRRNVQLIDKSGVIAVLTLWGAEAENFPAEAESVIAIKGAYVKEFQGNYSLSVNSSTRVEVNPEGAEYDEMLQWYARERPNMDVKHAASTGGLSSNLTAELRSITGLTHSPMCHSGGDKGIYFNLAGIITNIRTEGAIYASCPTPNCQKKVQDIDGTYRCEKCGTSSKQPKYRYMVSMEFADATGSTYLTLFDDKAMPFFGKTADEMNGLHQNAPDDYAKVLKDKVSSSYVNLRCRGRMETYNDQTRAKFTIFDIRPLDFNQYSQTLDNGIEFLEQLSD